MQNCFSCNDGFLTYAEKEKGGGIVTGSEGQTRGRKMKDGLSASCTKSRGGGTGFLRLEKMNPSLKTR